jgi:hypothetical protein
MDKSYIPKTGPHKLLQPIPYLWYGAELLDIAGRQTDATFAPKRKRKEPAPESAVPPAECHDPDTRNKRNRSKRYESILWLHRSLKF